MHRTRSWVWLGAPQDFGMHAVGPEDSLFVRNTDGKALCGVNSTNIRGKEMYSFSTYQWCLILQKEWDVSSSRWFNTLVNSVTPLPVSVLEYCFRILFKDRITAEDGEPHLS